MGTFDLVYPRRAYVPGLKHLAGQHDQSTHGRGGLESVDSPYMREAFTAQSSRIDKMAAKLGLSEQEYRQQAQAHIDSIVAEGSVQIRVQPDVLLKILEDGKFKTQIETDK